MDVFHNEFSASAEMVIIHLPFVVVDVVCESSVPTCVLEANSHESYASEELGHGLVFYVHYFPTAVLHFAGTVLNTELIRVITFSGDASA